MNRRREEIKAQISAFDDDDEDDEEEDDNQ